MLTQEKVREILIYNPETGEFFNRVNRRQARAGMSVGNPSGDGHLRMQIDGESYFCHRLAWLYMHGNPIPEIIDHKNGNGADNRIENLRAASPLQNTGNRKPLSTNSLGIKGVRKRGKRFQALITIEDKQISLGYFDDPQQANDVYMKAALSRFGEFARGR